MAQGQPPGAGATRFGGSTRLAMRLSLDSNQGLVHESLSVRARVRAEQTHDQALGWALGEAPPFDGRQPNLGLRGIKMWCGHDPGVKSTCGPSTWQGRGQGQLVGIAAAPRAPGPPARRGLVGVSVPPWGRDVAPPLLRQARGDPRIWGGPRACTLRPAQFGLHNSGLSVLEGAGAPARRSGRTWLCAWLFAR